MAEIKKKYFFIHWHIFPFETLVCLGLSRKDILSIIKRRKYTLSDEEDKVLNMNGNGKSIMLRNGVTILWTKFYPKPGSGVVAHEIDHVIDFITERVGITKDQNCDELFAYMDEYITNQITSKL